MKTLALPVSWRGRALIVRDVELSRDWFTSEELSIADAFRLPKRREEWMRARIAGKCLVAESLGRSVPRSRPGDSATEGLGDLVFSYSHSGAYAAAAIDRAPVGIDVETLREISESAAHFFLSEEEEKAMRACTIEHRLLHWWCAKEAAWKQRGGAVPTLKQIALRLVDQREEGLTFDLVETVRIDEVIAALTRTLSSRA